jgi:hypothetical protein
MKLRPLPPPMTAWKSPGLLFSRCDSPSPPLTALSLPETRDRRNTLPAPARSRRSRS